MWPKVPLPFVAIKAVTTSFADSSNGAVKVLASLPLCQWPKGLYGFDPLTLKYFDESLLLLEKVHR